MRWRFESTGVATIWVATMGWAAAGEAVPLPTWLRGVPHLSARDAAGGELPSSVEGLVTALGENRDGVAIEVPAAALPGGATTLRLESLRVALGLDRQLRVLRFEPLPVAPARVESLAKRIDSDHYLLITDADGGEAFSIRCRGNDAAQRITLERRDDGAGLIRIDVTIGDDGGSDQPIAFEFEHGAQAWSLIERAGLGPSNRTLASLNHDAAAACLELSSVETPVGGVERSLRVPIAGRPLDAFRGNGIAQAWAERFDGVRAAVTCVNPEHEARIVALALDEIAPEFAHGASVTDLATGEVLGSSRGGLLVPLPPDSTRRLALSIAASESLVVPAIVLVRAGSPTESATLESSASDAPDLESKFEETVRSGGVVIVHLAGAGSLEPVPPAIARHVVPRIVPHRAVARSIAPRGAAERFTKLASKLEWTLAFTPQPVDAREWLVCLEAGFLATPLQPRIVDGMPAARGFVVNLQQGALVVTSGLTLTERDKLNESLIDPKARLEMMRQLAEAQTAVRLDRAPAGLFAALSHLRRTRSEDFVPGDPVVASRWAVILPIDAQRRLRTLSVPRYPGAAVEGDLTEDVIVTASPIDFAIDMPRPFDEPFQIAVRRIDHGAEFDVRYEGTPLRRAFRAQSAERTWVEELYELPPEHVFGQPRVLLSLDSHGVLAEIARVGFFAAQDGRGRALGPLAPQAVTPTADAVTVGRRGDGTPICVAGKAYANALELSGGSTIEYVVPEGRAPTLLIGDAIAPPEESEGGGGVLVVRVDGEERARLDLQGGASEMRALRVELSRAQRITFECFARGEGAGRVFVIDPRVR